MERRRMRIQGDRFIPEQTQKLHALRVVPDVRRSHPAATQSLANTRDRLIRIGKEIQHQSRDDRVESAVSTWQGVGSADDERRARISEMCPSVLDKGLRWIAG